MPTPPASFPRRSGRRPRLLLIVVVAVGALIAVSGSLVALFTDVLWFRSVGYSGVFTAQLVTKALLFLGFGLLMALAVGSNLVIAYRLRPPYRTVTLEQQNLERYRLSVEPYLRPITIVVSAGLGLIAGSSAAGQWRTWMLFRNGQPFGRTDPQFGRDIGYFAFTYPFQRFLLGFAFAAVVLGFLAAVATHYLYGGLRAQAPGAKASPAARAHLSVLLGLFVLLKAIAYWLDRYGLAFRPRGIVNGLSYTDVNALLPAKTTLAVIAAICALLFLANIFRRGFLLPGVAFGLLVLSAIVLGGVYPAIVQTFSVKPSEATKEAPYVGRMIASTRDAYGIAGVERIPYAATTDASPDKLRGDPNVAPIRLLDPTVVNRTYEQLQQLRGYYSFPDSLDIDRYTLSGQPRDLVVAARELDLDGVPARQRNWINDHLVYTHGFGFVAAPANTVTPDGEPLFIERNIPPVGGLGPFEPRVYFGEQSPDYSVVGAPSNVPPRELDYPDESPDGQANTTYRGRGGVEIGSLWRRLLYAAKYGEKNLVLSDAVNERSRILYIRAPRERVQKVAPFLQLDGDPYPAVVGDRIVWIIDGYTTSRGYPYSEATQLGEATRDAVTATRESVTQLEQRTVNYIRNSVKAVVDAYDGTVTLYQWDRTDPVLNTWMRAFPDTVRPHGDIPDPLRAHFRYPEDLFKVQRDMLRKYHVSDPLAFYNGGDFWRVPADPTRNTQDDQPPYFLTLQMPGARRPTFSLTTAFVPVSPQRENLAAFMAVSADPGEDYGKIRVLELPRSTAVPGPRQVQNNFEAYTPATTTLTLLRQGGSDVTFGNLLTLPVGGGLLYVEPVYVRAAQGTSYPLLKYVLVAFGNQVAFDTRLDRALASVFGTAAGTTPPATATPAPGQAPQGGPPPAPRGGGSDLQRALADAQAALADAQSALRRGDFAAYGQAQQRLADAIQRASTAARPGATQAPAPARPPAPAGAPGG